MSSESGISKLAHAMGIHVINILLLTNEVEATLGVDDHVSNCRQR
jgi:hypothetical protein